MSIVDEMVEFLRARITEDEEAAREGAPTEWAVTDPPRPSVSLADVYGTGLSFNRGAARHIERWDPSRVLAECQAKRAIIETFTETELTRDQIDYESGDPDYDDVMGPLRDVLYDLAAVYADHPDYDERWRV